MLGINWKMKNISNWLTVVSGILGILVVIVPIINWIFNRDFFIYYRFEFVFLGLFILIILIFLWIDKFTTKDKYILGLLSISFLFNIYFFFYTKNLADQNNLLIQAGLGGKSEVVYFANLNNLAEKDLTLSKPEKGEDVYEIRRTKDGLLINLKKNVREDPPFINFYLNEATDFTQGLLGFDVYYGGKKDLKRIALGWLPRQGEAPPEKFSPGEIPDELENGKVRITLANQSETGGLQLIIPFEDNPSKGEILIKGIFAIYENSTN